MDEEMQEMESEPITQVLILTNQLILISEVQEILADIGQPDCRLINPYVILESGELSPWLSKFTNETEFMLSSDKILTLLEPTGTLLDNYLELTK